MQRDPTATLVLVRCPGMAGCDGCPHGESPVHCSHSHWAERVRHAAPGTGRPPGPVMRFLMRVWGS